MQLPEQLLKSLEGIKGFDKEAFLKAHSSEQNITSVRLNPAKAKSLEIEFLADNIPGSYFKIEEPVSWATDAYYLKERPSFTFDPLFHAGCYYVQEASSMFLEQALKQTTDLSKPLRILDLCAAPGGKTTHIQSLISKDSLLISNEVIRSRALILKDNIIKWGCENVIVTNNDPSDFSTLENYFDLIVIDAPCSGSGLFRKDEEALNEWSENNVHLCSRRQQRIIADAWPALKKEGVLIYSTCSYSPEEDEAIMEWIKNEFPVSNLKLDTRKEWGIVESNGGYRFWPDKVKGEGFFIAAFRKSGASPDFQQYEAPHNFFKKLKDKLNYISKKEEAILEKYVQKEDQRFIHYKEMIYGLSSQFTDDINLLLPELRIIYFGIMTGAIMKEKLIPAHALALGSPVLKNTPGIELTLEEAIIFLQKKDLKISPQHKGWQLVCYKNMPLGWINALPNRINNYYPKELRILKESHSQQRN